MCISSLGWRERPGVVLTSAGSRKVWQWNSSAWNQPVENSKTWWGLVSRKLSDGNVNLRRLYLLPPAHIWLKSGSRKSVFSNSVNFHDLKRNGNFMNSNLVKFERRKSTDPKSCKCQPSGSSVAEFWNGTMELVEIQSFLFVAVGGLGAQSFGIGNLVARDTSSK